MPGVWFRAAVAMALLLTWLVPGVRLAVLPQERAQAAAASELMCLSSRAVAVPAAWTADADFALRRSAGAPTLADAAAPMQRAFDKQWQTDATRVAFAVFAALALLASTRRFGGVAALLVIAAASLYLWTYEPDGDGYRLLLVTQSVPLWWQAVSQWSWALQAEHLLAPLTAWMALFGACWLLWRAESAWPRSMESPPRSFRIHSLVTRGR